jgi:UDP-N-acetylglucosamine--N-acetylmuramyl-(pentapeptide) pyrophosphoryl-undecaprenol N-acetylglucosamine transferase
LKYLATKIAVTVDESVQYFREGQAVITGYPLRESVMQASRDEAITHFGLDSTRKTLLVTGGSRGARSINIAVQEIAQKLLDLGIQIIHITGTTDWDDAQERASHLENQERYHLYPYLHDDMGLAYAVADIAICRAGASTLGELPYFELPSILVPYPYAWRYQKTNADYLADRSVAIQMNDEDMSTDLYPTLQRLVSDETEYQAMKQHAKILAQKNGSTNIAQLLLEMAGGSPA